MFPYRPCQIDKLKNVTDDNSKLDENGGKFTERVKNTVEKGEIACYEQIFLFQKRFPKTTDTFAWERVNPYPAEFEQQTITQVDSLNSVCLI